MLMVFQTLAIIFFGGNCLANIAGAVSAKSYMKSDYIAGAVFYGLVTLVFVVFWGHAV